MSTKTVQNALLFNGIAEPQASPFTTSGSPLPLPSFPGLDGFELTNHDLRQTTDNLLTLPFSNSATSLDTKEPILNPILGIPVSFTGVSLSQITSYTSPQSIIVDANLNGIVRML